MSVMPWSDTFCTIMSTFTSMSARRRNSRAAMPGWSGTPVIVIFASESSATTPVMIACSMVGSSSVIHVPGSQVKLERTCNVTWWVRANSTARIAGFGQPHADISSISSKLMRREAAGARDDAGVGGEHAGHVGVELARVGLQGLGERDRGGVGAAPPEERDVVLVGRHALRAADDRHPTGVRARRGCVRAAPPGSWRSCGWCR